MKTITQEEARKKVVEYRCSQVFTVTFVKRTTGETRVMNCRKGVKKYLSGGGLKYNPIEKGLVPVYEMSTGFRSISLDEIKRISMKGEVFDVE